MNDRDVQRLETERLLPSPKEHVSTAEDTLRQVIHVLACALGVGRWHE
jgi:hypothetical protein